MTSLAKAPTAVLSPAELDNLKGGYFVCRQGVSGDSPGKVWVGIIDKASIDFRILKIKPDIIALKELAPGEKDPLKSELPYIGFQLKQASNAGPQPDIEISLTNLTHCKTGRNGELHLSVSDSGRLVTLEVKRERESGAAGILDIICSGRDPQNLHGDSYVDYGTSSG